MGNMELYMHAHSGNRATIPRDYDMQLGGYHGGINLSCSLYEGFSISLIRMHNIQSELCAHAAAVVSLDVRDIDME